MVFDINLFFRASRAALNNKNPRTKIRGKAAGSLRLKARETGAKSQFSNHTENQLSVSVSGE
jgi:hypothetical protein